MATHENSKPTNGEPIKPQAELSRGGKFFVAVLVVAIGLGGLRMWRTAEIEKAFLEQPYKWRTEISGK